MALRDSMTGHETKNYSIEELVDAARVMRGYNLVALCAAGSGHAGGTLSIMDLAAALYLHAAEHDPANPAWPDRDRIIWSAGHKAPALYVSLGMAGFCPIAVSGPSSLAEIAGRRGLNRIARPGIEHFGRHGAGRAHR